MSSTYLEDNYNFIAENVNTTITSPVPSILFFITITSIFALLNIYSCYSKTNLDEIASSNNVILLIYICILLVGTYFINISVSKTLCVTNSIDWNNILFLTLLPWIVIFGLLYLLLEIFPGWVRPFSNTIGYVVVNLLGAEKDIKNILKRSGNIEASNKSLVSALSNIEKDYSRIINEFDTNKDNFLSFIKQFKSENFLNNISGPIESNELVYKLYQHVIAKHFIGKIVWYILSGILIASITYNFLLDIKCAKTADEIEGEYTDLNKKSSYKPIYGKKWKEISESELKNKTNATSNYQSLIEVYYDYFINANNGVVELSYPDELLVVNINSELQYATSIYIVVDNKYYIPVE